MVTVSTIDCKVKLGTAQPPAYVCNLLPQPREKTRWLYVFSPLKVMSMCSALACSWRRKKGKSLHFTWDSERLCPQVNETKGYKYKQQKAILFLRWRKPAVEEKAYVILSGIYLNILIVLYLFDKRDIDWFVFKLLFFFCLHWVGGWVAVHFFQKKNIALII